MTAKAWKRKTWLGTLGIVLLTGFVACAKKDDPAVADAGGSGGVATKRSVITMQGANR